jgi:antibiotic biosynthesis monooxygenase (ABM) superfamily enzyme
MCEPVCPPTEAAKKYRIALIVLAFLHLTLAIIYCFFAPQQGIYELIIVSILFCSVASVNFCCLTMYMIYIVLNLFTYVSILGLFAQNAG